MPNKKFFITIIASLILPVFFCAPHPGDRCLPDNNFSRHLSPSCIRAKSAGEVDVVRQDMVKLMLEQSVKGNANGSPVEQLQVEIVGCGKEDESKARDIIVRLINFVCDKDRQYRLEAAKALYELSKDKWYENIMRSIGGGKMVGLIRLIPFEEEFDFQAPEFSVLTDDLSRQRLREIFNGIEEGVYVLRSSSLFEDSDEFPLRKPYKSIFFIKANDTDRSFEDFCQKYNSVLGSLIETGWMSDRKGQSFLEGDRMFVLLQKVPGHREPVELIGLGAEEEAHDCYFPSLSGVSKHNPVRIGDIVTQANIGLNTTVVKGRYKYYINTDSHGNARISEKRSWGNSLSNAAEFISWKYKTVIGSMFYKMSSPSVIENYEILLLNLQDRLVRLMARLEQDFSPRGLEWSFDSGVLYVYQNTRSATHKMLEENEEFTAQWQVVNPPEEDIVIQAKENAFGYRTVLGHLIWIKPLPHPPGMVMPEFFSLSDETLDFLKNQFGEYIFICNRYHFISEDEDPQEDIMGKYFYNWLGPIGGWVDASGINVEICTHYADILVDKGISVISGGQVDALKLEQFCPNKFKVTDRGVHGYEVRYSDGDFIMRVNALTGEGIVFRKQPPAVALAAGAPAFVAADLAPRKTGIERDL